MTGQLDHAASTITLRVRLKKSDYRRAARGRFWSSLGWTVALAPLFAILPFWREGKLQQEVVGGNGGAIAVGVGLYLALALFLALAVEICARTFSQHALRKAPLALEPQVLTFSEKGLSAVTNRSSGEIDWDSFQKATMTGWAFQLHFTGTQYVLLPFSQMASPDERRRLRSMIKTHLGARAKFKA